MNKEDVLSAYRNRGDDYTWDIYQPIPLNGYEETYKYAGRKCTDRLEQIKKFIIRHYSDKKLKILDIGCNNGYFVYELARMGHTVEGVDACQKYIDKCTFLSNDYELDNTPTFKTANIHTGNIEEHNLKEYDLILCFSVIHHMEDKFAFLNNISRVCKNIIFEMDDTTNSEIELKTFYFKVEKIGFSNDPYGKAFKKRNLYFCDNDNIEILKTVNMIWGRNVFLVGDRVVKRHTIKPNHTWLNVDLANEFDMLTQYNEQNFFPEVFEYRKDKVTHEIHMEYIDNQGTPSMDEIKRFYDFLDQNNLIILDFLCDMFMFDNNDRIKIIDVESIVKKTDREKYIKTRNKSSYNTYHEQIAHLKKYFKL